MATDIQKKILIVEDEGIIAMDLRRRLVQAGYRVTDIATDATEAMAALAAELPDLVLMDIRIRGQEDGIEVASRVRRLYRLPVMFVTAYADAGTLERARITEPFGYIVKPFAGVNFHAQIEMALWKHAMEQKLRASEAWLAATVNNVADALITTDAEGNISLMNAPAAKLTGWDAAEAKGKPVLEVFRVFEESTGMPAVHPLELIYDGRALDSGSKLMRLFVRDNSSVVVESEMSANFDAQGVSLGIIIVFRDVTARRKAEAQERQLQKMNAITMLATGLGSELTQLQKKMDDAVSELLSDATGSARQPVRTLHKLLGRQQVLALQLAALGRNEPAGRTLVDLNQTLSRMEEQFRKLLGKAANLTLRLEDGLPPINVQPGELRENLLRLLGEARAAVSEDGAVEISTHATTASDGAVQVHIEVHDNGNGLRPNARRHVFDPYFQTRPGNRNSGLSLAVVHQFATQNGGTAEVESQPAIERGTTFRLTFPATTDRADSSAEPALAIAQTVAS